MRLCLCMVVWCYDVMWCWLLVMWVGGVGGVGCSGVRWGGMAVVGTSVPDSKWHPHQKVDRPLLLREPCRLWSEGLDLSQRV